MHRLLGIGGHINGTLGTGVVQTQVQVNTEVFEAVDLVVELGVAHKTLGVGNVDLVVEEGHRVLAGHGVAVVNGEGTLAVVPPAVAIQTGRVVNGLGGVISHGGTHGTGVGKAVVHIHTLGVEVHRQVLVQEGRSEGDGQGLTGHVGGLEGTVLVVITKRYTPRHIELGALTYLAGHGSVAFQGAGQAEDFLLPVGVFLTQGLVGGAAGTVHMNHQPAEFHTVQHIHILGVLAQGAGEVHVYVNLVVVLGALLGGDDDNTVGCTGTEDGGGRSVLQHGEALDIGRVDGGQRVCHAVDAYLRDGEAVDHDQRVVVGLQGGAATDTDGVAGTRSTITGGHHHTGALTLQEGSRGSGDTLVQLVGLHSGDRTGHIVLLYGTVTDDHHLVQEMGILFEGNGCGHVLGRKALGGVADAGDLNDRIGAGDSEDEVAVEAGGRTVGRPLLHNRSADYGAKRIFNHTFNLVSALGEYGNAGCEQNCDRG